MIDFHVDTIYRLFDSSCEETLIKNSFSVDVERMEKGGAKAICFALFTPKENSLGLSRRDYLFKMHDRFLSEIENANGRIIQAKKAEDVILNKTSAILTVEDMGPLEKEEDAVSILSSWSVKIASLIWNNENDYAYPNSNDKETMNRGLKKKGLETVEELASAGIILDVSHLNDGGFYDIYSFKVKMVATHSNMRALCNHQRNITDDMARKIADRGGIVGLNICPEFLTEKGDRKSCISDMARHVLHLYNTAGEDTIAMGSDLDGTSGDLELKSVLDYEKLLDELKKSGLSERQIDKFSDLNALRVLSQC